MSGTVAWPGSGNVMLHEESLAFLGVGNRAGIWLKPDTENEAGQNGSTTRSSIVQDAPCVISTFTVTILVMSFTPEDIKISKSLTQSSETTIVKLQEAA